MRCICSSITENISKENTIAVVAQFLMKLILIINTYKQFVYILHSLMKFMSYFYTWQHNYSAFMLYIGPVACFGFCLLYYYFIFLFFIVAVLSVRLMVICILFVSHRNSDVIEK